MMQGHHFLRAALWLAAASPLAIAFALANGVGPGGGAGGGGGGSGAATAFVASGNGASLSASDAQRWGHSFDLEDDGGAVADTTITNYSVTTTTGGAATTINFAQSGSFPAPSFTSANVGNEISVVGAGAGGSVLNTTISAVTSASRIVVALGASTALTASTQYVSFGSNNYTGIQAGIAAAEVAGVALHVPSGGSKCFGYSGSLSITSNLTVTGDALTQAWAGGINIPMGIPALLGSVLCPTSVSGADAVDITGTSLQVNLSNVGLLFQSAYQPSGDGISYLPAQNVQGLTNASWDNVWVFGHDGNHHAYNLTNPLLGLMNNVAGVGGGLIKLTGNSTSGNFGNLTFNQLYGQVVTGGTANGADITSNAPDHMGLLTFVRPQIIVDDVAGVSQSNPPTSAQQIWYEDANVEHINKFGADLETNVASPLTFGSPAYSNVPGWESLFSDASAMSLPAWGQSGALFSPLTRVLNDTTSSGAGAVTGIFAFPGVTVTANNATTYPDLFTMVIGTPVCGANCTATSQGSIYATGQIITTSAIGASGGAFITGLTDINQNSTSATNIGNGSTTGDVDVGGGFNHVKLQASSAVPAGGSASVGETFTSSNIGIYVGSGAPTLSAAQGSFYMRTDGSSTSTRLYVNTNGTTGWTPITTGT